jgi:hypothetical protein
LYANILGGNDDSLRRSNIASLLSDNGIGKACDPLMFSTGMPSMPLSNDLMQSNILGLNMDINGNTLMAHDMNHINMNLLQPYFNSKDNMGMHIHDCSSNGDINLHNMNGDDHHHHHQQQHQQHHLHHHSNNNGSNMNSHLQPQHLHLQHQHHMTGESNQLNHFNMNNMNFLPFNSNHTNNHMNVSGYINHKAADLNFSIDMGHPDTSYLIMNDYIMIQSGSVDGKGPQEAAISSSFDFEGFHNYPREKR